MQQRTTPIALALLSLRAAATSGITVSGFSSYGECDRHHSPSAVTLTSKCTNVNLGQDILYFWLPEVSGGCTVTIYAIADCPSQTLLQEPLVSDLCNIADLAVLSIGLTGCPGGGSIDDTSSSSSSASAPSLTPQNAGNTGSGGSGSVSGSSSESGKGSSGTLSGAALIATIVSPIIAVVAILVTLCAWWYPRKAKARHTAIRNMDSFVQVQRPIPMGAMPPHYHYGM